MKVLIMGDCNSIHIVNFIKVVLEKNMNNIEITLFDMKGKAITNNEANEYYDKNNIRVVLNNGLTQLVKGTLIKKIPKLRVIAHLEQLNKKINSLGYFDYCFVHFVDITKSILVVRNKERFKKIIPVFWGSDLLRNKKIGSIRYRRLFQISHKIVLNTENMKKRFEMLYNNEFDSKIEVIKFPLLSFEKIDKLQKISNVDTIKKEFGLPLDKIIVICGHAGYKEEQYEELIESLSKCKDEIKKKCYFVFLMTYGPSYLREYQNKIRNLLKEKSLDGMVMGDYLVQNELLKLFLCNDIYITTITTDAFSGVMQENLYCGAMLIYGRWLKYYELEDGAIVAHSIEKVTHVGESLEEIVMNLDEFKPQLKRNRELISDISSPKSIREMWEKRVL